MFQVCMTKKYIVKSNILFVYLIKADPPDTTKIPEDDVIGVTAVLITASYRDHEFVHVGYFVTNEYEDPEMRENPPLVPQFNKLIRTVIANEPQMGDKIFNKLELICLF